MPLEFEALVGHLHIVDGRSISAAPPGLLVEVAPKRAARGRELDTFFALVLPSDEFTAPSKFYEQMAHLAAARYFSGTGSVTAGLRTVFMSLNNDLTEHNQSGKRRYEANLLCAVLRDDELFLARVGSGVALLRQNADMQSFPPDLSNDEAIYSAPLGVHPVPDIKMTRYPVTEGTRLVMADARLADAEHSRMNSVLGAADIAAALAGFKALAGPHMALLTVEFVTPEAPSPVPAREAETTARVSGAEVRQTAEVAAVTAPPPEAAAPHRESARDPLQRKVGRGLGGAALRLAHGFERTDKLLGRLLPQPADGQQPGVRTATLTGFVVLIPVVIVVLVIVLWLTGTGESEFELCVEEAQKTADVARSISSADVNGTLAAWNAVTVVVGRCNGIRPGDPALAALTREGQNIVDRLFQIERRDAPAIVSFPNALLRRVVLQGLDLYVLDDQNQWVYRVTLAADGRAVVPGTQQPIAAMRQGAAVGEFRIGGLLGLAWSDTTTQIMALDDTGVLIACSPRFLQSCDAQRLLGAENWRAPIAMTLWQDKLYILDPGANQVWRYEPSGGTYASTPNEYFAGQTRPDIRSAVDFSIDDKGNLYILNGLGQITKWRSGEQTPFAFAGFPSGQQLTGADALFLNNDPINQSIYIVSRATRTIFETSLAGTFNHSYRVFNEDDFALISGVVADASQGMIYVLSGNSVFALARTQ